MNRLVTSALIMPPTTTTTWAGTMGTGTGELAHPSTFGILLSSNDISSGATMGKHVGGRWMSG